MRNNRWVPVLIFVVLLITIGAVFVLGPQSGNKVKLNLVETMPSRQVLVYFNKSKGSEIVSEPVKRDFPDPVPRTGREKLAYAMTQLLEGPTEAEKDMGYFTEIPEGTRLLSVEEEADRIEINLSKEFASGGGSSSMVQRLAQVTKTAVSVRQQKPVYLKVEGQQLDVLGGEGVMVHQPISKDPSVAQ